MNLGEEIPVRLDRVRRGGGRRIREHPAVVVQLPDVGVNIEMTPRVTYEGEIILDLTVESSASAPNISVAGQDVPSFGSRKVKTRLRLREGESNLLAGLLQGRSARRS